MAIQLRASSATRSWTHDVFLSFRGEDTRYNFTDHLHNNLVQKGINTFIDDELTRGEEISQALLQAIRGSKSSLIVFSENYTSSKWCLDELVHILESKRSNQQQKVWPVFYKVDPSDVRHQRGSFGDALANHEHNFKGNRERVMKWRAALTETANLSGWHFSDGYESKFIDGIVEEIFAQVKEPTYLDVPKCSVGLDSRVQDMLIHLDVGESDIRMVGIWGIGGIGKTTIAKAVYNSIAHKFECSCFLANVREESEIHGGLLNLQNILLSKIVRDKKAINIDEGITLLGETFRHKRILLILDDVNNQDQLDKLAGATKWFGHGSRIIITTRDKHLLIVHEVNQIYEARQLDPHKAREIFSSKAFKSKTNLDDDEKLAINSVVEYAQGLPLALVVLGSHLCGTSIHKWQAILDGCKRSPLQGIQKILKISYDALENLEKEVFLDIVCFFKGWHTYVVIQILECCGRINPEHSIQVLEEKTLIKVEYGNICLHDLIEEMGKEIVHQESPNEPGERSRLWYHKDVHDVLTENTGTSKIEGIMVKLPATDEIHLSSKCFKKMKNLKFFININARFCGKVNYLPEQLRFLDWHEYPLQSMPSNFNMKKLVHLNMPRSRISHIVKGFKRLENLKSMNFSECKFLTEIPDLSGCPNLEHLHLRACTSLVEVHPSVGFLEKLIQLDLDDCISLVKLPRKVNWRSLRHLHLYYCRSLESFPEIVGEMKCLTELYLNGCSAIKEFPSSIGYLINLESLNLWNCENLTNLPCSIYQLQNLKQVNLSVCSKFITFPNKVNSEVELMPTGSEKDREFNMRLKELKVCGFKCLENLKSMNFSECKFLTEIPDLSGCPNLEHLHLRACTSLVEVHPSVGFLEKLIQLDLSKCISLVKLPRKVNWRSLRYLNLYCCRSLESFPEIVGEMKCLTELSLDGCSAIKELPSSIGYLINLESLNLQNCENFTNLPCSIYQLQNVKKVDLRVCSKFITLPNKVNSVVTMPSGSREDRELGKFICLRELHLGGCRNLVEIPQLSPCIKHLDAQDCVSLERISNLSKILKREESQMIEEMNLTNCSILIENLVKEVNILVNDDYEEAEALFSLFLCSQQSKFRVRFPGSEIPKWFSCQMDFQRHNRFEIFIEILPNFKWENTGLALCVLKGRHNYCFLKPDDYDVSIYINNVKVFQRVDSIRSDNVWLQYIPFHDMLQCKGYMRLLPPFMCRVIISQVNDLFGSCGVYLVMPPNEEVCMKLSRVENLTGVYPRGIYKDDDDMTGDDDDDDDGDDDDDDDDYYELMMTMNRRNIGPNRGLTAR